MSEGGFVADHLNEFNTVTSKLSSIGVTFDDEVRALLFLCSSPKIWNGLVMAISNSISGSNTLNFDDVFSEILSEEMRRKNSSETSGNALTTNTRGKMERGGSLGYCSKSRKGRSKSRYGIVCWKCSKKGHMRKDCKSRKGKEGDTKKENNHEVNVTSDVFQDALILSLENTIDVWWWIQGSHSMPHLIGNIFMIMFKDILDRFVWVMINLVKSLEWVKFS